MFLVLLCLAVNVLTLEAQGAYRESAPEKRLEFDSLGDARFGVRAGWSCAAPASLGDARSTLAAGKAMIGEFFRESVFGV